VQTEASWIAGTIVRTEGPEYVVAIDRGKVDVQCVLGRRRLGNRPVVGDKVGIELGEDQRGTINALQPRTSEITRAASGGRRGGTKTIVANIDRLVVVASAQEPPPRPGLIDRYLVAARKQGIAAALCFNKWELAKGGDEALRAVYSKLGYPEIAVSAKTGEGLEDLERLLRGRQSAFVGHSGVGKTSLMRLIFPDIELRVGALNPNTHKGKHTTTHSQLLALPQGGYVVDTPGIREFGLFEVSSEELATLFPDFEPYLESCRYRPCSHTHEPGCAIKSATGTGLEPIRYEGYVRLYEELRELESQRYG